MSNCPLCGKRVLPSGKNCRIIDGQLVHKKCPKPKLSKQDSEELLSLKNAIFDYASRVPRGYMVGRSLNWERIMNEIGVMHNKGYSYSEIEYALHEVIKEMDGYWGIGALTKRIDFIVGKKRNIEQKTKMYKDKQVQQDIVDLRDLIDNDWGEEW